MSEDQRARVTANEPTTLDTGRAMTTWRAGPGVRVLVAGAAALLALACFSDDPEPTGPLPADCRQLALDAGFDPDDPDLEVVGIRDFEFVPAEVTVARGTRVVWVNCEGAPALGHTSTSDTGEWDSPLLVRGDTYERVFGDEGVLDYHCTPHPFMRGTVTVEDS